MAMFFVDEDLLLRLPFAADKRLALRGALALLVRREEALAVRALLLVLLVVINGSPSFSMFCLTR